MLLINILHKYNLNIAELSIVPLPILPILIDFSTSPGLSRVFSQYCLSSPLET